MELLQREAKLLEIVKLVGMESLSHEEKLTLEIARALREDFLFQNAFDPDDAFTPLIKQYYIIKAIMTIFKEGSVAAQQEKFDFNNFASLSVIKEIPTLKTFPVESLDHFKSFIERAVTDIRALVTT